MNMEFAEQLMPRTLPKSRSTVSQAHAPRRPGPLGAGVQEGKSATHAHGAARADRADISPMGRSLAQVQKITSDALHGMQDRASADYEAFMDAGKGEFLAEFESFDDPSARGTADMILNGITGYIFGAFASQYPEMSEEKLDEFFREATKGVNRGFAEAKAYLDGMGQFDGAVKDNAVSAIEMVHGGLAEFIDEQKQELGKRSGAVLPTEE